MARNGSGTFSPVVDFTTEAGAPPIEISKLDQAIDDLGDEITNSIAADGQTNPTANLPMNGNRHTDVGAATALTQYARVSELIDQDHIYYVDSGSANTYVITPSPAIAAYEEGQRFVFRATNANSGASTLNVNGLGAIAIQTVNGSALASGAIVTGGFYEVTYDANATPDRWVLTSMPSALPDGMLSANVALLNGSAFTGTVTFSGVNVTDFARLSQENAFQDAIKVQGSYTTALTGVHTYLDVDSSTNARLGGITTGGAPAPLHAWGSTFTILTDTTTPAARFVVDASGNFDFKTGAVTTTNSSASEVGFKGTPLNTQNGNYTLVLTDAGKTIYKGSGGSGETITIPANASVAFPVGTQIDVINDGGGTLSIAITSDTLEWALGGGTGTRTLADSGWAVLKKVTSTKWFISGTGLT